MWPVPKFGPPRTNRLGKPLTVVQRWAFGLPVPELGEVDAALAVEDPRPGESGDVEPGSEDDRVDLALGPVGADHAIAADLGQTLGEQLDVLLADGRVEVVGDEDPLAADRVARGQLAPQLGVLDLAAQVALGDPLGQHLHQLRVLDEAEDQELMTPEKRLPVER